MKLLCRVSLFIGLLFVSACTPAVGWHLGSLRLDASALQSLKEKYNSLHTQASFGRMLYRARLNIAGEIVNFRYLVAFNGSEAIRVETLPSNGFYTLALLVLKGDEVIFLDTQAKQALVSSDPVGALRRAMRLPLAPKDLLDVLRGRLPDGLQRQDVQASREAEVLTLQAGDNKVKARIDATSLTLQGLQFLDPFNQTLVLQVEYAPLSRDIPSSLRFIMPSYDAELELELQEINFSAAPKDSLFELDVPADYRRLESELD